MPHSISSIVHGLPTASFTRWAVDALSRAVACGTLLHEAWLEAREMQRQAHCKYPFVEL